MEHIRSSEQALEEQKNIKEELSRDVGSSRDHQLELQREIENVNDHLGDAKIDKHEDARRKKKQEVVELFRREIPGVYDRMINMSADQQTLQCGRYKSAEKVYGSDYRGHRKNSSQVHSNAEGSDAGSWDFLTVGLFAS